MSSTTSYYAWQPSIEREGGAVSIFLTRGRCQGAPAGGREFFEAVFATAGVRAQLVAWGVEPFFSRYFARTEWQECWNVRFLVHGAIEIESPKSPFAIAATPDTEDVTPPVLPVRVIADFDRLETAEGCQAALRERAAAAKWDEPHDARYIFRRLAAGGTQLLIDVTEVERSRLDSAIGPADEVSAICEEHGGLTSASAET